MTCDASSCAGPVVSSTNPPGRARAAAIWCWYSGLTASRPRMKQASLRTSVKLQDTNRQQQQQQHNGENGMTSQDRTPCADPAGCCLCKHSPYRRRHTCIGLGTASNYRGRPPCVSHCLKRPSHTLCMQQHPCASCFEKVLLVLTLLLPQGLPSRQC